MLFKKSEVFRFAFFMKIMSYAIMMDRLKHACRKELKGRQRKEVKKC